MDTVPNFFKRFYNLSTGGNKTNTPKLENRSRLFPRSCRRMRLQVFGQDGQDARGSTRPRPSSAFGGGVMNNNNSISNYCCFAHYGQE
ncbi:MAG: hypothetical protein IPN65_03605 [Elusimicrobia bacterium]|jgi:hypothetical protein|nr:hypothetical protein [Elusimicrobiota bacterium]MBK8650816.1 hypothetical protein [Elusimicrobiota bacterium]MBK9429574.1 hypothetical protein [Elusimicrobiota bacterium]